MTAPRRRLTAIQTFSEQRGLVYYRVPLDGGRMAELALPRYVNAADAARFASFVYALVIDPEMAAEHEVGSS